MLLQLTLASPPSTPDSLFPPIPHRLQRHHFVPRSEEHTSELQSRQYLVCRLLLEKKTTGSRHDSPRRGTSILSVGIGRLLALCYCREGVVARGASQRTIRGLHCKDASDQTVGP